ncbi:MAG TPA: hypothetical protein VGG79_25400 [Roseiarcus sp.]
MHHRIMSHRTWRVLAYCVLALAPFADGAEAGVGDSSGSGLAPFGRFSPTQKAQVDGGDCWYDNGWDGPGWYPCGNEWNNLGGAGSFGPGGFVAPTFRRHHRRGVGVRSPAPKVYRGVQPSQPLGAGVYPGLNGAGGASGPGGGASGPGGGLGFRRFHSGGFHAPPGFHGVPASPRIGAPASPGFIGRAGLHGHGGVGSFHGVPGSPHIGAPASPGFVGGGGFHGLGGVGGFHGGAAGVPHIGAPAAGVPHIGAPTSRGFVGGGGVHGVGGAGGFHGGAAGVPHIGAPAAPGFIGSGGGHR